MDAFIGYTIAGIAIGAIYAISATGLVVTYTTSGVFNFAHGATGMLMAYLYWQMRVGWHLPAPVCLVLVLLVAAPLLGIGLERLLIRPLRADDIGVSMVVTLGVLVMFLGVAQTIWDPTRTRVLQPFFGPYYYVTVLGTRISWEQLITIGLAVAVAVGLRILLFRARVGVAMRGVVDDRPLIALNGWTPGRLNAFSWAIGASLGALGGILQSTAIAGGLQVLPLIFLVVNAFAAALLGRLKSLPLTFAGAMVLGLSIQYFTGYVTVSGWLSYVKPALPTVFLFAILLVLKPARLRAGAATVTETLRVPTLGGSFAFAVVLVAAAIVAAQVMHGTVLVQAAEGVALGVAALSVVLLTGYGGQVSLAPYAFMGFGAWVFGKVAPGGSVLGLAAVAAVSGIFGALVALPALRLRGLYLALSTLAFAELAYLLFFQQTGIMGGVDFPVPRVRIPGVSVHGDGPTLVLEAVVFALASFAMVAVRRGRIGRLLLATRDSQAASATLGANLTGIRLILFGSASAIAGVGGALFAGVERSVNSNVFLYQLGLILVLVMYNWGVASVAGALVAGLFIQLISPQITNLLPHRWTSATEILVGFGAMTLGRNPNGVIGIMSGALSSLRTQRRDSGLSWVDRATIQDEVVSVAAPADV